jgi:hypothetical protein
VSARTYRDAVAALFRARPGEWIDAHQIAAVGGSLAWRTRCSECRTQLGMRIENRQVREKNGRCHSSYRFVPMGTLFSPQSLEAVNIQ